MTLQETWQAALAAAQKMNGGQEVDFAGSASSPLQPKLAQWEASVEALRDAIGTIGEAAARRKAQTALDAVKETTAAYETFLNDAPDGDGLSSDARLALLFSLPQLNKQLDENAIDSDVKTLRQRWQEAKEAAKKENDDEAPSFDDAKGSALGPKLDRYEKALRALQIASGGIIEKVARANAEAAYKTVKTTLAAYQVFLRGVSNKEVSDQARAVLGDAMTLATSLINGAAKDLKLSTPESVEANKPWVPGVDRDATNYAKVVILDALEQSLKDAGFHLGEACQLGEGNRFLIATKERDFKQQGKPVVIFPIGTVGRPLAPMSALPVAKQLIANGFTPDVIAEVTGVSESDQRLLALRGESEQKRLFLLGTDVNISDPEDATTFVLKPTAPDSFTVLMNDHNMVAEEPVFIRPKPVAQPKTHPVIDDPEGNEQTEETRQ